MLGNVSDRRHWVSDLRTLVIVGYDALATMCGLYGAALMCAHGDPLRVAVAAKAVAPLLVVMRLGAIMAARLHDPSHTSTRRAAARLGLAMLAVSVAFSLAFRDLPPSVYVVEFLLTTTLMAAFRFGPRIAEASYRRSGLARAAETFAAMERPRRALNVIVAAVGLALTLPLCIVIAMAIKLTSRGPVLYKQERVGLDLRSNGSSSVDDPRRKRDLGGRPFMMYKFRTMQLDAESSTGAVWSAQRDPRVTAVGRFLRYCRLDELPQLFNVLKGDMNVVGPRPERPTIFADLRAKIPDYPMRQRVRPGITGYAQVNLEYDASVEDVAEKLKFDLAYVSRQSVSTDLIIMAKTVPVMLFREKVLAPRMRTAPAQVQERRS